MKALNFTFNLKKALILSTCIHFFSVFPFSDIISKLYLFNELHKLEYEEIEFELYQAKPNNEKKIFIPKGLNTLNVPNSSVNDPSTKEINDLLNISSPLYSPPPSFDFSDSHISDLEMIPSLEEEEFVEKTEEKTSDSLQTEMDLLKLKEEEDKIKWDFCNRIRTLIENYARIPDTINYNVLDVIKVDIKIDRDGKLCEGYPLISKEELSRYPELNQAALDAIIKASKYFPKLPSRVKEDSITFSLPIKFSSEKQ